MRSDLQDVKFEHFLSTKEIWRKGERQMSSFLLTNLRVGGIIGQLQRCIRLSANLVNFYQTLTF